ncbi:MAG: cation:proton antiporter [Candidatus Eisenbacteria bacterium]|nr:cation:proton antiporter [Candidatus Eisenbacteria bacterium]MCC7141954.1 cation:proton antiporter [Candidatus Eisenbacteria bacterium]
MGSVPLLDEIALIVALGVAVTLVLSRIKVPSVAGLLLAGAIAGPFGLRLVPSVHAIELLAEVGVVLLLFTIGLEFSLSRLRQIFRDVALGGALQVGLTVGVTFVAARLLGKGNGEALFYGFVFALSSTAIVLRSLAEKRELNAPHGRFITGTLLFQDLCVVPMVLVIPLLATPGHPAGAALEVALALGKAFVVVVLTFVLARILVPRLFQWVEAARSREVFLLTVIALCIGTAWFTSLAGVSLALGAFLGGVIVADTEHGHRAMGDMLPLRDVFLSLFFVSLGMLFDIRVLFEQPLLCLALVVGFLAVKAILATLSALAMGFPATVAWAAGLGLAQFGEFGFVIARLAETSGVVSAESMRPLLASGVISMFVTPFLFRAAPHMMAGARLLAPLERKMHLRGIDEADEGGTVPRDHVVVVGFGLGGRVISEALVACGTAHVVLELDAERARAARASGLPVFYADAASEEALQHAHLGTARAMVLLMNDPIAAARVAGAARRVAPQVPILARARYLTEREELLTAGARDVVAEEVEGSVEILARLLRWLEAPRNVIEDRVRTLRVSTQSSERRQTLPRPSLGEQSALEELKVESLLIREAADGLTLAGLSLRKRTGALVVAIRRNGTLIEQPDPHEPVRAGDLAYLVGTSRAVRAAAALLDRPPPEIASAD